MKKNLLARMEDAFGEISSAAVLGLATIIFASVVYRVLSGSSMGGLIEIAEVALVVCAFGGVVVAYIRDEHVSMTLVSDNLPKSVMKWVDSIASLISLSFVALMIYATGVRAIDSTVSRESRFGILSWPIWPTRWIVTLGLAGLFLVMLIKLLDRTDPKVLAEGQTP